MTWEFEFVGGEHDGLIFEMEVEDGEANSEGPEGASEVEVRGS